MIEQETAILGCSIVCIAFFLNNTLDHSLVLVTKLKGGVGDAQLPILPLLENL